jgi:hypothetical protein
MPENRCFTNRDYSAPIKVSRCEAGLFTLVGPLGAATYERWPASVRKGLSIDNWVWLEVEDWTKRTQVKAALSPLSPYPATAIALACRKTADDGVINEIIDRADLMDAEPQHRLGFSAGSETFLGGR